MRKYLFILSILLFMVSCKSSDKAIDENNSAWLQQRIDSRQFQIQFDFAQPLLTNSMVQLGNSGLVPPGSTINRISLMGNEGIFRMDKDSVYARLPYFGERQLSDSYNSSDVGIVFNTVPTKYSVEKNEKKGSFTIQFNAVEKTEAFRITLHVYPNKVAQMIVNSTHRRSISYYGDFSKPE